MSECYSEYDYCDYCESNSMYSLVSSNSYIIGNRESTNKPEITVDNIFRKKILNNYNIINRIIHNEIKLPICKLTVSNDPVFEGITDFIKIECQ